MNNYPLRYVILTFNKMGNYKVGVQTAFDTVGYIVSPAFLVSERTNYFEDGTSKKYYDVVLPIRSPRQLQIEYPERDEFGRTMNTYQVDNAFKQLSDAKSYCFELNDSLKDRISSCENDESYYGFDVERDLSDFNAEQINLYEYERELFHKTRGCLLTKKIK